MRVPDSFILEFNNGVRLLERGDAEKAVKVFRRVEWSFKELYLNLGNAYRLCGKYRLAAQAYRDALRSDVQFLDGGYGEYAAAWNNLGLLAYSSGDDGEAIACYCKAIELDSEYGDAHWNLSSALLRQACSGVGSVWDTGWAEYEWRFKKSNPVGLKIADGAIRKWQGEVGDVVVLVEQGIGDLFMWGRYFSCIEAMGCRVWVQCAKSLHGIVAAAGFGVCTDPREVAGAYAIPLCSLSGIFGRRGKWDWLAGVKGSVGLGGDAFKIGIVSSGSSTHTNDKNRSVSMQRFKSLVRGLEGVELYNLNPGEKKVPSGVTNVGIKDWLDTVAWVREMDLVICVDTSIAHLCGALGVECWVLMPLVETDFRWGSDAIGSSNIWYPSVKVYRNPNDWGFVFDTVREDLKGLLGC